MSYIWHSESQSFPHSPLSPSSGSEEGLSGDKEVGGTGISHREPNDPEQRATGGAGGRWAPLAGLSEELPRRPIPRLSNSTPWRPPPALPQFSPQRPWVQSNSVAQSHPTLWHHGLQHARPPCPSPTPEAYLNSCPSSRWCHPTISSSVVAFSSCLQSFPASGSFQMSLFFASGGQSVGVSASASVLPMNTQDWSPLRWTGWISLQSKGALKSLLQHHSSKASILWCSAFFIVQLSHPYMTSGKTIAWLDRPLLAK